MGLILLRVRDEFRLEEPLFGMNRTVRPELCNGIRGDRREIASMECFSKWMRVSEIQQSEEKVVTPLMLRVSIGG